MHDKAPKESGSVGQMHEKKDYGNGLQEAATGNSKTGETCIMGPLTKIA